MVNEANYAFDFEVQVKTIQGSASGICTGHTFSNVTNENENEMRMCIVVVKSHKGKFTLLIYFFLINIGIDFVQGPYSVAFSAGQRVANLLIQTLDDSIFEFDEQFQAIFDSVSEPEVVSIGSENVSTITITDDEGRKFSGY